MMKDTKQDKQSTSLSSPSPNLLQLHGETLSTEQRTHSEKEPCLDLKKDATIGIKKCKAKIVGTHLGTEYGGMDFSEWNKAVANYERVHVELQRLCTRLGMTCDLEHIEETFKR